MNDDLKRQVADGLSLLVHRLNGRTAVRLYDLNIASEDFVRVFLNCIRDLNLVNLNRRGKNHPAIDLGDIAKRVSFQVTTEKNAKKIQEGLDKFLKHGCNVHYDQIFFIILGKKQAKYSTLKCGTIRFDPLEHIVDVADLIREASDLDISHLKKLVTILKDEGLIVSESLDSDEEAFRKMHSHFDRDALKHRWHQEGKITGFETALAELTELLGKGTIQGKTITKPIYSFDRKLAAELSLVRNALGNLKAAFNERVNSHEIRPGDEFAFFKDRETAEKMNAAKMKVLEEINKIAQRYHIPPISLNDPQFSN